MMKSLFSLSFLLIIMLSILYLYLINKSPHPIFMLLLLLIYTISICLTMSIWTYNSMLAIMLFLMMISGLLIIFLYFSSLISNVKNNFIFNLSMIMSFMINLYILFFYTLKTSKSSYPMSPTMESNNLILNMNLYNNICIIYTYPYNIITLMSMMFLLITLFLIIKTCSMKSTMLRKISN